MNTLSLTEQEFEKVKEIMYQETGVYLRSSKKALILNRLRARLSELNMHSFTSYLSFLQKNKNSELENFINLITTNETYFFRHTVQFNYLYETIFPLLEEEKRLENKKKIRLWSAACSSGEEAYSMAIICKEYFKNKGHFEIEILASDVNSEVVAKAQDAKYNFRVLRETPESIINKYFIKSKKSDKLGNIYYSPVTEIKSMVHFFTHNLMKILSEKTFDVIFIRNALIYFDLKSKQKVINNLTQKLNSNGYLLISLAENLSDININLKFLHSGIYRKNND